MGEGSQRTVRRHNPQVTTGKIQLVSEKHLIVCSYRDISNAEEHKGTKAIHNPQRLNIFVYVILLFF